MLSTYATRFHASAIASGLTLPTVHGGGVALPGSDALKASPAYAAVTAANRRTDATAARFRMDALAGRPLAGGMRLDAAAKPEALLRDAYAMALVWEHSQSAAWRQQQRGDGSVPGLQSERPRQRSHGRIHQRDRRQTEDRFCFGGEVVVIKRREVHFLGQPSQCAVQVVPR